MRTAINPNLSKYTMMAIVISFIWTKYAQYATHLKKIIFNTFFANILQNILQEEMKKVSKEKIFDINNLTITSFRIQANI